MFYTSKDISMLKLKTQVKHYREVKRSDPKCNKIIIFPKYWYLFLLWHNHWKMMQSKDHLGTIPQLFQAYLVSDRYLGELGAPKISHDQWPKNGLLEKRMVGLVSVEPVSEGKLFQCYLRPQGPYGLALFPGTSWIKLPLFTNIFVLGLMCDMKGFIWMTEQNETLGVQIYFESVTLSKIADFFTSILSLDSMQYLALARESSRCSTYPCETTRRNYAKKSMNELKPYQL